MRLQHQLAVALLVMLLASLVMSTAAVANVESGFELSSKCPTSNMSNNEHINATTMLPSINQSTEEANNHSVETPANTNLEPLEGPNNQDIDMQQLIDTHKYDSLIGKTIVAEKTQDGTTVTRAYLESLNQESGEDRIHAVRVIGPGIGYTRDYRPGRVNFLYDEYNKIFMIQWFYTS